MDNVDITHLINTKDEYDINGNNPIAQPYFYLKQIPSNNLSIRTRFLHAFNELYHHIENVQLLELIGEIISIFHDSSLLIDDIEDNSQFRRGLPTAHTKFGVPLTINCGNLMYFVALQKAQIDLPNLYGKLHPGINLDRLKFDTSQILIKEMLNLHHGQGLDIYWRDYLLHSNKELPSIEDYLCMVKNKTGGLFRLSIKLLNLFSTDHENLIPVANLLGIIYQIRDDYMNLVSEKYSHMKGMVGEDLVEGKLSLPILHCLLTTRDSPVFRIIVNTSPEQRGDKNLIDECILYLEECGSLEFTKQMLFKYYAEVKRLLEESGVDVKNTKLMGIIDAMCDV
jgi:geranylgeranyl diphosphate synthase type 3